jgi:ATP-dependent Clp protease ATP-binding subunit ClpB
LRGFGKRSPTAGSICRHDLVKGKLIELGYDPAFGARPLKRAIQRFIQDPLALKLLNGSLGPGATARVTLEGDEILLQAAEVAVN